jgi:hypothetical protein
MFQAFKHILCFTIVYCTSTLAFAQTNASSQSLLNISDSTVKKEIASFTKTGKHLSTDTSKTKLVAIPISACSDKSANWAASKFFGSVSTFIHVYFLQENSIRKVDSIFLVTHSHFWVKFPEDAYKGIVATALCNFSGGKKQEFFSDYYKAFYSNDKRRIYIYMLGETESNKYEVTWVVVNDKYWGSVMDGLD